MEDWYVTQRIGCLSMNQEVFEKFYCSLPVIFPDRNVFAGPKMQVDSVFFASPPLASKVFQEMRDSSGGFLASLKQLTNVACLPGKTTQLSIRTSIRKCFRCILWTHTICRNLFYSSVRRRYCWPLFGDGESSLFASSIDDNYWNY